MIKDDKKITRRVTASYTAETSHLQDVCSAGIFTVELAEQGRISMHYLHIEKAPPGKQLHA